MAAGVGAVALRLPVDRFVLAIVATVAMAVLLPCPDAAMPLLRFGARAAIALLFFLYGAKLAPSAVWRGLRQWRLQLLVLAGTFVLFPLLGLASRVLPPGMFPPELYVGFLFLCLLPSTVQSSVIFTGLAGGNVAAAVSATSASSLIGMAATPLLAALLLGTRGEVSLSGLQAVVLQLHVPFFAGQLARPLVAAWLERRRALVGLVDRGSVLLIVYMVVSAGMGRGVWGLVQPLDLFTVLLADLALLALALGLLTAISRRLRLPREDEIVVVFCAGNKGLVTGVSMMTALLPSTVVGIALLPLLLFHQMQLIVTAILASRYARQSGPARA
jgi:solute carrier family 10 (sodium/bile acid cotransporter), member 7